MFDFSFLNPSKRKAMWYGLMWGGITILFLAWQWWPCLFAPIVCTLFYGGVWLYKFNRDQKIVEAAAAKSTLHAASQYEELPPPRTLSQPPMTSKGSNRLFVPPPLTDR